MLKIYLIFLLTFIIYGDIISEHLRKVSSVGRASALQAEGHRFEPYTFHQKCGFSSFGRARPCQGRGGGFEPRNPLQKKKHRLSAMLFLLEHFVTGLSAKQNEHPNRLRFDKCTLRVLLFIRDKILTSSRCHLKRWIFYFSLFYCVGGIFVL